MPSNKPLKDIYKESFFCRRHKMAWRAPVICTAIASAIQFDSVIDVGCAIGDLVAGFQDLGKHAFGIEGSQGAEPYLVCPRDTVFFRDLRRPLDSPAAIKKLFIRAPDRKPLYGLVTALEVAEHIEPEYAEQFVTTLTELSNRVLISAAPPGQKGHYHVNCQPVSYWDALFGKRGYVRKDGIVRTIKDAWAPYRHKDGVRAYDKNLHYYEARNATPDRCHNNCDPQTGSTENNPGFLF